MRPKGHMTSLGMKSRTFTWTLVYRDPTPDPTELAQGDRFRLSYQQLIENASLYHSLKFIILLKMII